MKKLILPIFIILLASFVSAECGDGIFDSGENCVTCPLDVKCASGETCNPAGYCESPSNNMIYILVGAGIIALIIIIIVVKKLKGPKIDKNVKKMAEQVQKEELNKPQQQPAEQSITMESITGEMTGEDIQKINELSIFIKSSLDKGYSIEQIKQALLKKGWQQKYVDKAAEKATKEQNAK